MHYNTLVEVLKADCAERIGPLALCDLDEPSSLTLDDLYVIYNRLLTLIAF